MFKLTFTWVNLARSLRHKCKLINKNRVCLWLCCLLPSDSVASKGEWICQSQCTGTDLVIGFFFCGLWSSLYQQNCHQEVNSQSNNSETIDTVYLPSIAYVGFLLFLSNPNTNLSILIDHHKINFTCSWPETCACARDCDVVFPRLPKDPYLPYHFLKKTDRKFFSN